MWRKASQTHGDKAEIEIPPLQFIYRSKASLPELISGVKFFFSLYLTMDVSWQLILQWNENIGMLTF